MSGAEIDIIVNRIRGMVKPMGDGDRRELLRRIRDDVFCLVCGHLFTEPFEVFDPTRQRCPCPQEQAKETTMDKLTCEKCGEAMWWSTRYERWHCNKCGEYKAVMGGEIASELVAAEPPAIRPGQEAAKATPSPLPVTYREALERLVVALEELWEGKDNGVNFRLSDQHAAARALLAFPAPPSPDPNRGRVVQAIHDAAIANDQEAWRKGEKATTTLAEYFTAIYDAVVEAEKAMKGERP